MSDLPYVIVRREPDERMLHAARDWSAEKYGKPIGNDAANECWGAMIRSPSPVSLEEIVEVLKALAGPLEGNWDCQPDDTKIIMGPHRYDLRLGISLGDLRRARSLLSRLASMEAKP